MFRQKSGLFMVVISQGDLTLGGVPVAAASHWALSSTSPSALAARSNQYQPPSPNGFSDSSNTEVVSPSTWTPSTRWTEPRAFDL